MSDEPLPREPGTRRDTAAEAVLNALPLPVLTIGADSYFSFKPRRIETVSSTVGSDTKTG